jgi:hypothetical protein
MIIHNPILTGSLTLNNVNLSTGNLVTTGSNTFVGNQILSGSLTVSGSVSATGTLTAQTLVVQTITSSVDFVTGSTRFGSIAANTHVFTGSMSVSGSITGDGIIMSDTTAGAALPSASGASQSSGLRLRLTTKGSSTAVIDYGTAGGSGGWIQATNKSDLSTNYNLLLNPNGGNVGIGTTSPLVRFQITQPNGVSTPTLGTPTGGLFIAGDGNQYGLYIGNDGNTGNSWLQAMRNNTATPYNILLNPVGGNVGIGTTTTNEILDIEGNMVLRNSNTYSTSLSRGFVYRSSTASFGVQPIANITFLTTGDAASAMTFTTRNGAADYNERMRISSAGFVGIQTSSPTCPLHVLNTQSSGGYPSLGTIGTGTSVYICNNNALYGMLMGMLPNGNGWIQVARTDNQAVAYNLVLQPLGGSVTVTGALSKGSGSFRIKHPLASKKYTHQLVHSFIEGPQADLIYRGKIRLVAGKATINIDEAATMTEGTFEALCREVQCFTTNETGWDAVRGKVIGNILTIESQNAESTDEISWMVVGERQDEHMMDTEWTDENGKVIVEPLI